VPKIAQSKLNEAKLEIQGINILDTDSESYTMEVNSTIETDGSIHATVYPFTGQLYLEGVEPRVPFGSLDFPQTSSDKHQIVNVSQHNNIEDMDAFKKFNIYFVNNETVDITVEGDTEVKPSGLDRKYGVTFKKTISTKGLNLFKGTKVSDGKITLEEDDDGYNFHGTADIPNASHFTIDIGNLTFKNFVEDTDVGTLDIHNLVLHPGSNVVPIAGALNQIEILNFVKSDKYCESGIVPFKLLGDKVENNGNDIPYLLAGLASSNQTVDMDIATIIHDSLNIDITCGMD
jgi:hypothetical protein